MKIVIAGAGQSVSHWTPGGEEAAPSPHSLRVEAARAALGTLREVDVLAVVRTTEDSVPTSTYPHGRNANPPGTLARDLRLSARERIYHHVGGQSPQELVGEAANRIARGEIASALIVGAEATGASKLARRAGLTLDWSDDDDSDFEDRGAALDWLDPDELRHGLMTPALYYGLMETALAHSRGMGRAAHRRAMGELFAPFSEVASRDRFAQFGTARRADWLGTPSADNYPVADPYLKWHVAQDAVNQGAAVLVMGEARADALGLAPRTYVCGGGEAVDAQLSRRAELHRSDAMAHAVRAALDATGREAGGLDALDLYSCFPVAVWSALEALEGGPDGVALTVTGGLPFFGGPGNNYSLHAIARMHDRLAGTDGTGLVLANGGWMSKESVGVYSGAPCGFAPVAPAAVLPPALELARDGGAGVLESATFAHGREGPRPGTALVRLRDGRRALATVSGEALARLEADVPPIGAPVDVVVENGVGRLAFSGAAGS